MEILVGYNAHKGPRCEGAGIKLQIHGNQVPGILFKVEPSEPAYRRAIERGLKESAHLLGHNFLKTGSIWILEIHEHLLDSSEVAFYRAARLAINQIVAYRNLVAEQR